MLFHVELVPVPGPIKFHVVIGSQCVIGVEGNEPWLFATEENLRELRDAIDAALFDQKGVCVACFDHFHHEDLDDNHRCEKCRAALKAKGE